MDVSNQILAQETGETPNDLADQRVVENADLFESWLAKARAAASRIPRRNLPVALLRT